MLRYVKFDLLQRNIIEFCCSRVIFHDVKIHVPDDSLLFNNDFIESELKRYKRTGSGETSILHGICGKCDGYGFFDWVTHIRIEDGAEELDYAKSDLTKPLVVKNENPIETIFAYVTGSDRLYIYYISLCIAEAPMSYRCNQCQGTGLSHSYTQQAKKCKPEDLINIKPPPIKTFSRPTLTWYQKFVKTLKVIYIMGRLYVRAYKNRKRYSDV